MTKKEMRKLEKKQQKEEERLVGVIFSLCVRLVHVGVGSLLLIVYWWCFPSRTEYRVVTTISLLCMQMREAMIKEKAEKNKARDEVSTALSSMALVQLYPRRGAGPRRFCFAYDRTCLFAIATDTIVRDWQADKKRREKEREREKIEVRTCSCATRLIYLHRVIHTLLSSRHPPEESAWLLPCAGGA
jgi:hypothetical protein